MKRVIIVAVVALLIAFVGYLALRASCELEAMKNRHVQQADELRKLKEQQADELRKLKEELAAERVRRQRLEEVISRRRR